MKRTGFKQKQRKPLKRTPLKRGKSTLKGSKLSSKGRKLPKRSKAKISTIQRKIWKLLKVIIRERDGNVCFICGQTGLVGSNWHTGHFIPKSTCGTLLKYDVRNLHSSCYRCNIHLGGNGALFYKRLVEEYGQEFVDVLFVEKQKITKGDILFYQKLLDEYEKIQNWNKAKLLDYTINHKGWNSI